MGLDVGRRKQGVVCGLSYVVCGNVSPSGVEGRNWISGVGRWTSGEFSKLWFCVRFVVCRTVSPSGVEGKIGRWCDGCCNFRFEIYP